MAIHHWTGIGTAELTEEQAVGWGSLDGVATTPLALQILQVACLVCGLSFLDAGDECIPATKPEDKQAAHRWVSLMTLAMTTEEAAVWAHPDAGVDTSGLPRSVNLICVLCGQPYAQADSSCPEREFWTTS